MYKTDRGKYVSTNDLLPTASFAACLKKLRYYEPRISKRIVAILPKMEFPGETLPQWVVTLMGKPPFESGMGAIYTNSKSFFNAANGNRMGGYAEGQWPDDYYVLPHKKWPAMINRDGSIPRYDSQNDQYLKAMDTLNVQNK
jgi:hypothetical protein